VAPGLVQTYDEYKERGVVFIGLTAEGAKEIAETEAFIEKFGITWPNGYGAAATINALGVTGIPSVFVIGADGKIAWNDRLGGELHDAIEKAIQATSS